MLPIETPEEFENWLKDKPVEWAQDLALRSALRALPFAFNSIHLNTNVFAQLTYVVLRATSISWAARECPSHDMAADAARAAAYAVRASSDAANAAFVVADSAARAAVYGAYAARAAAEAAYSADAADAAARAADSAAFAAANAAYAAELPVYAAAFWQQLTADCEILSRVDAQTQSVALLTMPLWTSGKVLKQINDNWTHAASHLDANGLQFWRVWFQRRLDGKASGFALPREQDLVLQERLLDQPDVWWTGGQKQPDLAQFKKVTQEIEGWVAEQRELIDAAEKGSDKEAALDIEPQAQFVSAPTFRKAEDQKISLDFQQRRDDLRTDQDAIDRHSELLEELRQLREQCAGSNSLGHVVNLVDRLVEALGAEVSEMRTSLVVQRGERIRQLVETYENLSPVSLHEKVDEFVFNHLKATRDALNMVVGLDPVLDDLDRARLGPDIRMAMVAPAEVKDRFGDLADQGIVTQDTKEFVDEAVDLAPDIPDPESRQSRTVDLLAQNFVRYSIELISAYPNASAWAAAGTGVAAVTTLGDATAGGGMLLIWALARNIVKNEDKYRRYVGSSPANQANFDKLIAFLKSLPL